VKFQKHPAKKLVELFRKRPFQGQHPELAKIIFLSSDANYSPEISNHSFFEKILEYQADGVAFWKRYGCHHPFLLESYPFNKTKDGVPFHRNFSKLGLTSAHACHISFLELLDVPTIGNKSEDRELFFDLLSLEHLRYIHSLICSGENKLFFVSRGVLRDMARIKRSLPVFEFLNNNPCRENQYTQTIHKNQIIEIYHFSSTQIHSQIHEISTKIKSIF